MSNVCPVTHQPLISASHVVHDEALNRLTTQTMNLAGVMHDLYAWLGTSAPPGAGTPTQPTSRPPLKLGAWETSTPHLDTLNTWAFHLLQHLNPRARFHDGHWAQIQSIYQMPRHPKFRHQTQTWEHTGDMIEDALDALTQLERIMTPSEQPRLSEEQRAAAIARLETDWHPLPKALHLCQQIYGDAPTPQQVYNWKHRGQIRSLLKPPHYKPADLWNRMKEQT